MPTLERTNPVPLYYQLKEVLKQQIRAGHLAPHSAIPSEPELVANYQVSRATVRQALAELVHEGLLYRVHGRGTFVCEPRVRQDLTELVSFSQEVRQRGQQPGGTLLISELVRGDDTVRQKLALADSDQAVRLERMRTADAVPVAREVVYLPYPRASAIYERAREVGEGSLYDLMHSEGLGPAIAEQSISAGIASEREVTLLDLAPGEAGIRLTSTTFDQTGAPIEYSETFYPASRYDIRLSLRVTR